MACLTLTGTLSANVIVTWPLSKFFLVRNYTTGNFKVTLQYTGGVGASVIPPQGCMRQIMADSVNGLFAIGLDAPGTYKDYAAGTSALPQAMTGEYLLCDGSAVSRTTYAQLVPSDQYRVCKTLQRIARSVGITDIRWHDLRRTCGYRLLQDHGFPMERVSKWLGHSIVAQTERAYAFLDVRHLHAEQRKVAQKPIQPILIVQ